MKRPKSGPRVGGESLLADLPAGRFACIMADCPWLFRTHTDVVSDRDPRQHYKGGVMKLADIMALPVGKVAAPDAHLFLWVTGPCLEQGLSVIRQWGFKYSGIGFCWVKLRKSFRSPYVVRRITDADFHVGLGYTTRKNTELCLLARRGNARRTAKDVRELIVSPRREHSRKPDEAYARAERYCAGPYLDIFGRQQRPGWTVVGDETTKFAEASDAAE